MCILTVVWNAFGWHCVLYWYLWRVEFDICSKWAWSYQTGCCQWSTTWSQYYNWTWDIDAACSRLDFTLLASNSRQQTYICRYLLSRPATKTSKTYVSLEDFRECNSETLSFLLSFFSWKSVGTVPATPKEGERKYPLIPVRYADRSCYFKHFLPLA